MAVKDYYYAFISYSRIDEEQAKWLHYQFEHYILPTHIKKESLPTEFSPIFRDEDELASGFLDKEIVDALTKSNFLVLLCSPASAQSTYVNLEIELFIESYKDRKETREERIRQIIPIIISGVPYSGDRETECFPPVLKSLRDEGLELRAPNVRSYSDGLERSFICAMSTMLELPFDSLWDRRQREVEKERNRLFKEKQHLQRIESRFLAEKARELITHHDTYCATMLSLKALPTNVDDLYDRPVVKEAEAVLRLSSLKNEGYIHLTKQPRSLSCIRGIPRCLEIDGEYYDISNGSEYDLSCIESTLSEFDKALVEIEGSTLILKDKFDNTIICKKTLPFYVVAYDINHVTEEACVFTKDSELYSVDIRSAKARLVSKIDIEKPTVEVDPKGRCAVLRNRSLCLIIDLWGNKDKEIISDETLFGSFDKTGEYWGYIKNFGDKTENRVLIFNLWTWKWHEVKPENFVEKILFVPDDKIVTCEGCESKIGCYSILSGVKLSEYTTSDLTDGDISNDGTGIEMSGQSSDAALVAFKIRRYLTAKKIYYISVWNFRNNSKVLPYCVDYNEPNEFVFSQNNGALAYSYGNSPKIRIISLTNFKPFKTHYINDESKQRGLNYTLKIGIVKFDVLDDDMILCVLQQNEVALWNLKTHQVNSTSLDLSGEFAIITEKGVVTVNGENVNILSHDGRLLQTLSGIVHHKQRYPSLAVSSDGKWMAVNQHVEDGKNNSLTVKQLINVESKNTIVIEGSGYGNSFFAFNNQCDFIYVRGSWTQYVLHFDKEKDEWIETTKNIRSSAKGDRAFLTPAKIVYNSAGTLIFILEETNSMDIISSSDLSIVYGQSLNELGKIQGMILTDDDKYILLFSDKEVIIKDPFSEIIYMRFNVGPCIKDVQFSCHEDMILVLTAENTILEYRFPLLQELIDYRRSLFKERQFAPEERKKFYLD